MDLKKFRSEWNLLNEKEKDMLKVIAIAYEPLSRKNTAALLNETGIRTSAGLKFSDSNARPYLLKLMSDGFLSEDRTLKITVVKHHREWVMRMAVIDRRFKDFVRDIQRILPYRNWSFQPRNFATALRDLRIAFYQGDLKRVEEISSDVATYYPKEWSESSFYQDVFEPFDPKWVGTFPKQIQGLIVSGLLADAVENVREADTFLQFIEEKPELKKELGKDLERQLFLYHLQRGNLNEVERLGDDSASDASRFLRRGVVNFLRGNNDEALNNFSKGGKLYKKEGGDSSKYISEAEGLFHALALLKSQQSGYLGEVKFYTTKTPNSYYGDHFAFLGLVALHLENHNVSAALFSARITSALQGLFFGWSACWTEQIVTHTQTAALRDFYFQAYANDYKWLAAEYALLLAKIDAQSPRAADFASTAQEITQEIGVQNILPIVRKLEKWERALQALSAVKLKSKRGKKSGTEAETRLIWLVDFQRNLWQPKEQKMGKTGSWSKGRNVSLKRMKEEGLACMTDQDNQVKKAIKRFSGYYGATEFEVDFYQAARILVGHPLLFLNENANVSVELIQQEPELVVEEKDGQFEMRFMPEFESGGVSIVKETPTRYILMDVNETHLEIRRLLGGNALTVPPAAKDKLIKAVSNVSSVVTVHSVVGGGTENMPTVEGDTTIYVHLLPIGDGFKLEFFVKPFKIEPPYFKPGAGRNNAIAEITGSKTLATRDLDLEKANAAKVIALCPTLESTVSYNQEWTFDEVEHCLNVLLELEPLREAGQIILEYPKGEKLKIVGQASFGNLSMNMSKKGNWFEMDGEVQVNEDRVMDFAKMLMLAEDNSSNFIEVSKGQFVAITEQLRLKMSELNSLLHKTKNGMQLHPLAAGVLDDFEDELADFKADKAWKSNRARLEEALEVDPKIPSTFKAELRDYQKEGFRWLNQLAHWGVGACLADDMGLGKTVQGLALILSRAKNGPSMVVAPASVARNWLREAEKFTPTLNPILFGAGDRIQAVADLKPFDLLITSYGLMQQESELLATTNFSTLVLDEAQAIKNRATKRSKAAMSLQSDFRVATTGTPIENHLGELWNLFNFLNPGLLGSLQRFNEKFAMPIEKYENKEKRQQLRKLLQPFILRRRKTDVLSELPPKTEITLTVELSPDERAYYEALRRKAVDKIESVEGFGAKRFQILAELMRLRQACCNVKMIDPTSELSSSKLELFGETVKELLANGHKALVFSQFVKHLRLIEEWVKENNIPYQYLDGQTPLPKRETAINAFQDGEGELFLISLKAGGTGLNLTAADYVLHLDPWWNPAVEDQASDRAHRIGQQRPVTIYRLVAEDTIEEKIVQLHGEKRDLADSLLEGTESSGKMSGEDLLGLIKGG